MMHAIERLRQARQARGMDLPALAKRTRLRVHLFEAVDHGRWDDLPRGVYARAVIRAYAEAVGLDPNAVVTEVAPLLPRAEDPLDGMARVRGFERRPPASSAADADPPAGPAQPPEPHGVGAAPWSRLALASAFDASILAFLVLLLVLVTAGLSGASVPEVLEAGAGSVAMLAALVVGLYFFLLGGIVGATPGERLAGAPEPRQAFRGTAAVAGRRAGRLLLEESSIVLAVLARRSDLPPAGDRPEAPRSRTRWEAPAAAP
jgi:hypothetical protein